MSNLIDKQWKFASAAILFQYWVFVFAMPFLILSQDTRSGAPLWFWGVLCVAIGYFSYTGYKAWRRRWKARFVLRIVIPAALFITASVLVGLLA